MRSFAARAALIALVLMASAAVGATVTELSIWTTRDATPGPKVRMTISTRNIPSVHVEAYRLTGVYALVNRDRLRSRPTVDTSPVKEWDVTVASREDTGSAGMRDVYSSRQVNLPPLTPGAYLIIASGGGKNAWSIVNLTNLAVVTKRAPKQLLTWVCDVKSGRPLRNARVAVYNRDASKPLVTGLTGNDGSCLLNLTPADDLTAIVTSGSDISATHIGNPERDGTLKAHFQTDRPIYRPGQTMSFKAILRTMRGRIYEPIANQLCSISVRDPKDIVLMKGQIRTNAIGTLAGEAKIPSEGAVGPYTIVIDAPGGTVYHTFSVAEYRKPEYKVEVAPVNKRYLAGEDASFVLSAEYFFGAPVPQASVSYRIRRSPNQYGYDYGSSWYSSDDGNLYPGDTYRSEDFVAEGTVYTDAQGRVTIPFKTTAGIGDSTYTVTCTAQDASRRQVEASSSVPVYAAEIRLSVSTDIVFAPVGANIPLKLSAVDLDGAPSPARVTLAISQPYWNVKEKRYRYRELTRTKVDIPSSGRMNAVLPAKAEGDLLITAETTDRTGRRAAASLGVWVNGIGSSTYKREQGPTVTIRLDKKSYAPGDTVKALVTTNHPGLPILLTQEGTELWRYEVVTPGKGGYTWSIPTTSAVSPNFDVEAAQWVKGELIAAGATVRIPDASRRLNVTIRPDREKYRPGDRAEYTVKTTTKDGKPVAAEVSIAVIDEAIYSIRPDDTPDLYLTFWNAWPNKVSTTHSAPEELSGGAYQRVSELAPVRQRFLDTAFWGAQVMTDADGTARVSFEVPGNLTTWRATARAVTADTRVGTDVVKTQASRPVMLRLATPRQLVQGDRVTLVGTVNNRTDLDREFEVMLGADNLRIDGPTVQRVRVPANGEATVRWTVTADTLPEQPATVRGKLLAVDATPEQAVDLSDALQIALPIVPNGVARQVATAGTFGDKQTFALDLPKDRIEPASSLSVTVFSGLSQVGRDLASRTLAQGRYGTLPAADQLVAATILGLGGSSDEVRESIALISNYQQGGGGWNWWRDGGYDPVVTAGVLTALARARSAGIEIPGPMVDRGIAAAANGYNATNLWEHRALLASALSLAGAKDAPQRLDEVLQRGTDLSPYARMALAEGLIRAGKTDSAAKIADDVVKDAAAGPDSAYVPVGDHPGWSTSTIEATAQTLLVLTQLDKRTDLQSRLTVWLADPGAGYWRSQHESALSALALKAYTDAHPEPSSLEGVEIAVNGAPVTSSTDLSGKIRAEVPRSLLRDENSISIGRTGGGQAFYRADATVYRPAGAEESAGVRVLRRFEVRDAAGMWTETTGVVKASDPVRVTVLIWPGERPDPLRLTEPIPAGFEFIESDYSGMSTTTEVRDRAVVHYLTSGGDPIFYRYYLRAEADGAVAALPVSAEALRRPQIHANTTSVPLEIR